jgi:uncharacterized membrane protein
VVKKKPSHLRKYFITGILVAVPLYVTVRVLQFLVTTLDGLVAPYLDRILGFHIPGLGILSAIAVIFVIGLVTHNYLGRKLVRWNEWLIDKIPIIRSIYSAVKTLLEALFMDRATAFSQVVLVDWFKPGQYALGFVTGIATNELQARTKDKVVNVFVPTTPNPTSGFFIMIPEKDVLPLAMSIEDAFKLIMSGGILTPEMPPEVVQKLKSGTLEIKGGEGR